MRQPNFTTHACVAPRLASSRLASPRFASSRLASSRLASPRSRARGYTFIEMFGVLVLGVVITGFLAGLVIRQNESNRAIQTAAALRELVDAGERFVVSESNTLSQLPPDRRASVQEVCISDLVAQGYLSGLPRNPYGLTYHLAVKNFGDPTSFGGVVRFGPQATTFKEPESSADTSIVAVQGATYTDIYYNDRILGRIRAEVEGQITQRTRRYFSSDNLRWMDRTEWIETIPGPQLKDSAAGNYVDGVSGKVNGVYRLRSGSINFNFLPVPTAESALVLDDQVSVTASLDTRSTSGFTEVTVSGGSLVTTVRPNHGRDYGFSLDTRSGTLIRVLGVGSTFPSQPSGASTFTAPTFTNPIIEVYNREKNPNLESDGDTTRPDLADVFPDVVGQEYLGPLIYERTDAAFRSGTRDAGTPGVGPTLGDNIVAPLVPALAGQFRGENAARLFPRLITLNGGVPSIGSALRGASGAELVAATATISSRYRDVPANLEYRSPSYYIETLTTVQAPPEIRLRGMVVAGGGAALSNREILVPYTVTYTLSPSNHLDGPLVEDTTTGIFSARTFRDIGAVATGGNNNEFISARTPVSQPPFGVSPLNVGVDFAAVDTDKVYSSTHPRTGESYTEQRVLRITDARRVAQYQILVQELAAIPAQVEPYKERGAGGNTQLIAVEDTTQVVQPIPQYTGTGSTPTTAEVRFTFGGVAPSIPAEYTYRLVQRDGSGTPATSLPFDEPRAWRAPAATSANFGQDPITSAVVDLRPPATIGGAERAPPSLNSLLSGTVGGQFATPGAPDSGALTGFRASANDAPDYTITRPGDYNFTWEAIVGAQSIYDGDESFAAGRARFRTPVLGGLSTQQRWENLLALFRYLEGRGITNNGGLAIRPSGATPLTTADADNLTASTATANLLPNNPGSAATYTGPAELGTILSHADVHKLNYIAFVTHLFFKQDQGSNQDAPKPLQLVRPPSNDRLPPEAFFAEVPFPSINRVTSRRNVPYDGPSVLGLDSAGNSITIAGDPRTDYIGAETVEFLPATTSVAQTVEVHMNLSDAELPLRATLNPPLRDNDRDPTPAGADFGPQRGNPTPPNAPRLGAPAASGRLGESETFVYNSVTVTGRVTPITRPTLSVGTFVSSASTYVPPIPSSGTAFVVPPVPQYGELAATDIVRQRVAVPNSEWMVEITKRANFNSRGIVGTGWPRPTVSLPGTATPTEIAAAGARIALLYASGGRYHANTTPQPTFQQYLEEILIPSVGGVAGTVVERTFGLPTLRPTLPFVNRSLVTITPPPPPVPPLSFIVVAYTQGAGAATIPGTSRAATAARLGDFAGFGYRRTGAVNEQGIRSASQFRPQGATSLNDKDYLWQYADTSDPSFPFPSSLTCPEVVGGATAGGVAPSPHTIDLAGQLVAVDFATVTRPSDSFEEELIENANATSGARVSGSRQLAALLEEMEDVYGANDSTTARDRFGFGFMDSQSGSVVRGKEVYLNTATPGGGYPRGLYEHINGYGAEDVHFSLDALDVGALDAVRIVVTESLTVQGDVSAPALRVNAENLYFKGLEVGNGVRFGVESIARPSYTPRVPVLHDDAGIRREIYTERRLDISGQPTVTIRHGSVEPFVHPSFDQRAEFFRQEEGGGGRLYGDTWQGLGRFTGDGDGRLSSGGTAVRGTACGSGWNPCADGDIQSRDDPFDTN